MRRALLAALKASEDPYQPTLVLHEGQEPPEDWEGAVIRIDMPNITGTNALQGGPRLAPGASFSLRG